MKAGKRRWSYPMEVKDRQRAPITYRAPLMELTTNGPCLSIRIPPGNMASPKLMAERVKMVLNILSCGGQ